MCVLLSRDTDRGSPRGPRAGTDSPPKLLRAAQRCAGEGRTLEEVVGTVLRV